MDQTVYTDQQNTVYTDQQNNYTDTSIPLGGDDVPLKRVFFHQFIAFQISKNPHLMMFAKQNLIATHPRAIYKVEFGEPGEWFITYSKDEDPVRYSVMLTRDLNIADVSWSQKNFCYFNFLLGTPFVIDSDLISLLFLASLEGDMTPEVIGEWMRSVTRGRYTGFNPVHLSR